MMQTIMKKVITVFLFVHLTTLYACKIEGAMKLNVSPTTSEQLIEKIDTNIFNTWILIKSMAGGPNIRVGCGDRHDCWYTAENDNLIIHKNNDFEYHPIHGKIREGQWTINNEECFLFKGIFDPDSTCVTNIELKFNRIEHENSTHLILTRFDTRIYYKHFIEYDYELLKKLTWEKY
jgi:hypothetical protein